MLISELWEEKIEKLISLKKSFSAIEGIVLLMEFLILL